MEKDKISIIVPVYAVEKYLNRCVSSICQQTYENLEVVLVDDGSLDRCGEICDEWAQKDKRIRVVHQKNGGISKARNAAINIVTGDYIGFVDSDDYIEPQMYEKLYHLMTESQADMVFCSYQYEREDGSECARPYPPFPKGEYLLDNYLIHMYQTPENHCTAVVVWNKLYHRSFWDNHRFAEGKINEDDVLVNDYFGDMNRIVVTEERLYHYVCRDNSVMNSAFSAKRLAYFYTMKERTEKCIEYTLGEDCIRANARQCITVGVGFWLCIRRKHVVDTSEERKFYNDVLKTYKQYKKYGSVKDKLIWGAFRYFPRVLFTGYCIKKFFSKHA